MLSAALDWYYGSNEEFLLASCQFGKPFATTRTKADRNTPETLLRPGSFENGSLINVFTVARKRKKQPTHLEESAKFLRILRHPNILRFVGCTCVESEVHLVTEHAYPLYTILKSTDAHEICSGLHDIALAIQFIHEKASVSHNYICCESIYVAESGSWKLGGFEYACKFSEQSKEIIQKIHQATSLILPEEKELSKLKFSQQSFHSRDVYLFGMLVEKFSDQIRFSSHVKQEKLKEIIIDMLREDFTNRPSFQEILSLPIFKSSYISIVHFLQSVTLKTKSEKEQFFKNFLSDLQDNHIFAEVVGKRLVPLLLTPIILAEESAMKYVIKHLLTPVMQKDDFGVLPDSVFAQYVIPKIVSLFKLRLLHVRIALIENFSSYVHLFEKSVLDDLVLPELLLGLGDSNNQLVQASLHALADAVPVVGGDVIVGSGRQKIFSLAMPKFDGHALNESQSLAYNVPLPPRAKLPPKKKTEKESRLPATLLELALRRPKSDKKKDPLSEEAAMAKQKAFAVSLTAKSPVTNGHAENGAAVRDRPEIIPTRPQQNSARVRSSQAVAQKREPKTRVEVEVETWASSDEQKSDEESWPSFEDEEEQGGYSPSKDQSSSIRNDQVETATDLRSSNSPELVPVTDTKEETRASKPLRLQKQPNRAKNAGQDSAPGLDVDPIHRATSGTDSSKQSELGTEFEIVVKPVPRVDEADDELDFFADMTPKIKSPSRVTTRSNDKQPLLARNVPETLVEVADARSVDSGQGSTASTAFNLVDDAYGDADGWDDEMVSWD